MQTDKQSEPKKTYYAVHLECLDGPCVFETKKEAEDFRQEEIDNAIEPLKDGEISDVFELELTEEELNNRIES